MKAYVIKNKEGKYHKRGFNHWENIERDGVFNTGHFYYSNKEEAESCIVSYDLKDCKVVPITIAEGDLEEEIRILKSAYQSACEKLAYVFGECPYSNMNLQMPDYCEEECYNNEKYLCWDKYFIEQAKGEEK